LQPEEVKVSWLDVRIAVAVMICSLTAAMLNHFGIKFTFGEMKLEVIQKMTACIACLLCCQDNTKISLKAGINRLIITALGGIVGIAVILIDGALGNEWGLSVMVGAGVLLTLFLCKAAKVPYINARIGGVTFVLVSCTLSGNARICYAVFRLISTCYGVLVVMLVTWVFSKAVREKPDKCQGEVLKA
jgi:uncharacterized membrane protein YccC